MKCETDLLTAIFDDLLRDMAQFDDITDLLSESWMAV